MSADRQNVHSAVYTAPQVLLPQSIDPSVAGGSVHGAQAGARARTVARNGERLATGTTTYGLRSVNEGARFQRNALRSPGTPPRWSARRRSLVSETETLFRAAVGELEELAAEPACEARYRRDYAVSRHNLGYLPESRGRPAEAEHEYGVAIGVYEKPVTAYAGVPNYQPWHLHHRGRWFHRDRSGLLFDSDYHIEVGAAVGSG
jgi:hypothetical protein